MKRVVGTHKWYYNAESVAKWVEQVEYKMGQEFHDDLPVLHMGKQTFHYYEGRNKFVDEEE